MFITFITPKFKQESFIHRCLHLPTIQTKTIFNRWKTKNVLSWHIEQWFNKYAVFSNLVNNELIWKQNRHSINAKRVLSNELDSWNHHLKNMMSARKPFNQNKLVFKVFFYVRRWGFKGYRRKKKNHFFHFERTSNVMFLFRGHLTHSRWN